jgi:hypothetical protein
MWDCVGRGCRTDEDPNSGTQDPAIPDPATSARSWIADGAIDVVIATGGVAGGTYLFALPGSPGACRDGWDDILKWQLDSRFRPCNLVELMPRLQEHLKASA